MFFYLSSFFLSYLFPLSHLHLSQAKQLERRERELASISNFYKEQLETLEKKVRTIFHLLNIHH